MATRTTKARVAGVLHSARKSRHTELPEEDTPHAEYAAEEIDEVIISKAVEWYRIGARRGAIEVLQAILDGKIGMRVDKDGKMELLAGKKAIEWKQALTVNTVSNRIRTETYTHALTIEALGFK